MTNEQIYEKRMTLIITYTRIIDYRMGLGVSCLHCYIVYIMFQ